MTMPCSGSRPAGTSQKLRTVFTPMPMSDGHLISGVTVFGGTSAALAGAFFAVFFRCATAGEAGVALAQGLDGGLYLSGRFVFEAMEHTDWGAFRELFEAKGRLTGFVKALPTWAIANPASVLVGAARRLIHASHAPRSQPVEALVEPLAGE